MGRLLEGGGCRRMMTALLAAALLAALLPVGRVAHADGVTLTVGYSDSDGITVDEEGNCSGYVVDYLEELARYTGWEYEFVYDSWGDHLDGLERGELDLLVLVHYTEELGETLLFSELPMAHDYTALYAAADSGIYYQDYEAFDNSRVGVVAETVFEESFDAYAREQELHCEILRYDTEARAKAALLRGDIDLIATSGFSFTSELKLVDRFNLEGAYLATGARDQALMDQLNEAIQKARISDQDLENDLMQTYYGANSPIAGLYLTREEQEYLDCVGAITILGFDGRRPLGYINGDGAFVGVLSDYLDVLGDVSGLKFAHEAAEPGSLADLAPLLEERGCAMLFIDQSLAQLGLEDVLCKSDPLFETGLAYIRRDGGYVDKEGANAYALINEMTYMSDLLLEANPDSRVLYYSTSQECMEAVLEGSADMAILDEHVATYLLQKPQFADALVQVPGSGYYGDSMCLYATEEDRHLISILNKTLASLSSDQRADTVADAMLAHSYEYQLEDLLYEYSSTIRVFVAALVVILGLLALLYRKIVSLRVQQREKERLAEQVQLDELTGIYNRSGFLQKAGEMIAAGGDDLCIVRLNVCHFKVVNELYGTEKGDRLLREIGQELKTLSQQKDLVVGRFTGDHFYLCLRREDFDIISFADCAFASWLDMNISANYGVYPVEDQKDIPVNAMCDRADMALSAAAGSVTEHIFYYSDESRRRLLREQEIENEMEQAVAQRQFRIFIQPKYDIGTENIVGGEALVRWFHPEKGMIPPGEFIGLFERNGFIMKLDHYVWEECCRFLAEAREKGLPPYPLSTNVSRIHFYGTELQGRLQGLLDKYGLSPEDLELEITESVCSEEPELIFKTCEELRRAGFRIAMDDFGSGYSSLNMLKEMPLDIIKMDLRFLSGETDSEQAEKGRSILATLIQLAHTLRLKVVVEGLETEDQKDFVQSIGDCVAQGYYYSRPIDCGSYEELLRSVSREEGKEGP